jgi:sirohydrochlorin ferrochelatase
VRPSLLLVAHGSADPAATANVLAVCARLSGLLPGVRCAAGFLERAEPTAADALAGLPRPVVAVPYLLAAAFHARVDVAGLGADVVADVLGSDAALLPVAADRLAGAAGGGGPVVLAVAGTSDEGANAESARFGALLAAHLARPVVTGYASAAAPTIPEAIAAVVVIAATTATTASAAGAGQVTVLRWLLSPGSFADRIAAAAGTAAVTDVIADHPAVARLLVERYEAAAAKIS